MRLFLAVYLPVIIAYGDIWKWIWDRWFMLGYYSHGPLLPIVAAVVIFTRFERWSTLASGVDPRGWWLLGFGLMLRLMGAAQTVDSMSAGSLVFTATGLVLLTGGRPLLRATFPVICLLLFAVPMPIDLTGRVAFELKEVAIESSLSVSNMFGLEVVRDGASIDVPGQSEALPVADACGGLRSLLALTTLGYCLAFFLGSSSLKRRLTILAITVPLAVLVNILRIVGLCFMAHHSGIPYAGGAGHDIMNVVAWTVNIIVLLWVDSRFARGVERKSVEEVMA